MTGSLYVCDPALHNGAKVPADWFLRIHKDGEPDHVTTAQFACCDEHLSNALRSLIGDNRHSQDIRICRVTTEAEVTK